MCLQKPYVRKTTGIFHFWFLQTLHVPKYYFVYANNLFHVSLFVLNINMLFNYELNLLLHYLTMIALTFAFWKFKLFGAANKGQSTVNYGQSLAFDRPYLSCNDHCDRWLFQKIFLSLLFSFRRNSLEWSWTCFLEIVKHSKQFSILCLRADV